MQKHTWSRRSGQLLVVSTGLLILAACASSIEAPAGASHPADPAGMAAKMPEHDKMQMGVHRDPMMDMQGSDMSAMDHRYMDNGAMPMTSGNDKMAQPHDHGGHDHGETMGTMPRGEEIARLPHGADRDPASGGEIDRVVEIAAIDVDFEPKSIRVRAGETIRFVVTNEGAIDHEFVIGDRAAQLAHAEQMAAMGSGMDHSHSNAMMLKPGETKELVWTFEAGQDLQFACHVAGHYDAGMWGTIELAQ